MMRPMRSPALVLALTAACGGGTSSTTDGAPAIDARPTLDAAPGAALVGNVTVFDRTRFSTSGAPYRYPTVVGAFQPDGLPVWHTVTQTDGACTLREFRLGFCEETCEGYCLETGCVPYEAGVSVGTLTFEGLAVPLTIEPAVSPFSSGQGYYVTTELPEDLVPAGAAIAASAPGDVLPAFVASATAPPELVAAGLDDAELELDGAGDVEVTWPPADPGSTITLAINANNTGHGAPFHAILECVADDDAGVITISRALLDAFPEAIFPSEICAGADCPPSSLTRSRTGRAAIGTGEVELTVGHRLEFGAHLTR